MVKGAGEPNTISSPQRCCDPGDLACYWVDGQVPTNCPEEWPELYMVAAVSATDRNEATAGSVWGGV